MSCPVPIHGEPSQNDALIIKYDTFVIDYDTYIIIYDTQKRTNRGANVSRRRAWLNTIFYRQQPNRSTSSSSVACPKKRRMTN